ncbi:kinase-like domain-containing protein [Pseudomassariella vexata]|uniref:Kinase-like domain-containing protein n=1 Tax=Pseudomassariella vexata TaxID=1141098 RepID=A0A1Y2DNZ0_9PEZI|nr:kinase-like domain-containing protein [Pseudomassariella vexata]ORY61001.1 kinase-like domain-containing protein [Pseudomassariella vexata]
MSPPEIRNYLSLADRDDVVIAHLLREKIKRSLTRSCWDKKPYVPIDVIMDIFRPAIIKPLIDEINATKKYRYIDAVQIMGNKDSGSRYRILGILIQMQQLDLLHRFIEEGVSDDDFPIINESEDFETCITRNDKKNTTLLRDWGSNNSILLPWSIYQRIASGLAYVHKVQIHPSHHHYKSPRPTDSSPCFALKTIEAPGQRTFEEELEALIRSSGQKQKEKHLIKLLLMFSCGNKFYLMFDWADGNLKKFWKNNTFDITTKNTNWLFTQFHGIVKAVRRIQGRTTWQKNRRSLLPNFEQDKERDWGRHGDIKPENILWFSQYDDYINHLVVSDLGLTRYHTRKTRPNVPLSKVPGYTSEYRAPELELRSWISQKYDIWSLGCVYLEFCIWYLRGNCGVGQFGAQHVDEKESDVLGLYEARFFNIVTVSDGEKVAQVKESVGKWMNDLRRSHGCPESIRQMLNLIQTKMLVVDPAERWDIGMICTEIWNITELAAEVDDLLQYAEGNAGATDHEIVSSIKRARLMSIHSSNGDPKDAADLMEDMSPLRNWGLQSATFNAEQFDDYGDRGDSFYHDSSNTTTTTPLSGSTQDLPNVLMSEIARQGETPPTWPEMSELEGAVQQPRQCLPILVTHPYPPIHLNKSRKALEVDCYSVLDLQGCYIKTASPGRTYGHAPYVMGQYDHHPSNHTSPACGTGISYSCLYKALMAAVHFVHDSPEIMTLSIQDLLPTIQHNAEVDR